MTAEQAATPWLRTAPPWPLPAVDDDHDTRVPKRQRRAGSVMTMTSAELTMGKWATAAAIRFQNLGWRAFVAGERGEPHLSPDVRLLPHPARHLLHHLRVRGAGVPMMTAPWTRADLQQAAHRGSHQSAANHVEFVCTEMLDFARQGFWTVLPLAVALNIPHLRLSPLGVVPQRNRRPRLIVDYTFSHVNAHTLKLAPPDAMQFGKALHRIMHTIVNIRKWVRVHSTLFGAMHPIVFKPAHMHHI